MGWIEMAAFAACVAWAAVCWWQWRRACRETAARNAALQAMIDRYEVEAEEHERGGTWCP